jgi:hypothetical protein
MALAWVSPCKGMLPGALVAVADSAHMGPVGRVTPVSTRHDRQAISNVKTPLLQPMMSSHMMNPEKLLCYAASWLAINNDQSEETFNPLATK